MSLSTGASHLISYAHTVLWPFSAAIGQLTIAEGVEIVFEIANIAAYVLGTDPAIKKIHIHSTVAEIIGILAFTVALLYPDYFASGIASAEVLAWTTRTIRTGQRQWDR